MHRAWWVLPCVVGIAERRFVHDINTGKTPNSVVMYPNREPVSNAATAETTKNATSF
jgi:hypothetical protein